MKKNIGAIYILIAGFFWGFMGVFSNLLQDEGFNPMECATLRIVAASLIFLIYTAIFSAKSLKIKAKSIPLLAATGCIGVAIMSVCYITAIDLTSLSVAAVLLYTSPVWVMIMASIFLKDKFTAKKAIAAVLAFAGCAFITGFGKVKISFGFFVGICAGITYASYRIFRSFALKKYEPLTVTCYAFLFGAVFMLIIGDIPGILQKIILSGNVWKTLLLSSATGLFTAVLPFLLYTKGLSTTNAGKAAVLACIEPVTASLLGMVIYNEKLNLIGIILIFSAILMLQMANTDINLVDNRDKKG